MTSSVASAEHHAHEEQHAHPRFLAHHFESSEQQFDSGKLGMWLFLVTEVMFFSGLFCAYAVYRAAHPEIFIYAHKFLDTNLGAINTVVLLVSSLTMALAVRAAQLGQQRMLILHLILTLACAGVFLSIKYVEYSHKWHSGLLWAGKFHPDLSHGEGSHDEHVDGASTTGTHDSHADEAIPRNAGIFFSIYFCLTGLHGIHILAGMGAIVWILVRAIRGDFSADYYGPVDFVGLYWHLVDLIWIYLFPLLYLIH
jgi:cytochrome c oxidase subunit 3